MLNGHRQIYRNPIDGNGHHITSGACVHDNILYLKWICKCHFLLLQLEAIEQHKGIRFSGQLYGYSFRKGKQILKWDSCTIWLYFDWWDQQYVSYALQNKYIYYGINYGCYMILMTVSSHLLEIFFSLSTHEH